MNLCTHYTFMVGPIGKLEGAHSNYIYISVQLYCTFMPVNIQF